MGVNDVIAYIISPDCKCFIMEVLNTYCFGNTFTLYFAALGAALGVSFLKSIFNTDF